VGRFTHTGGWPTFASPRLRLPLDKNEGAVKDKDILSSAGHRFFSPEGLRTKTLEMKISRSSLAVEGRSTNHRFGLNHRP
jgi:hypothetical protein